MKCEKCDKEFSESDKVKANYRSRPSDTGEKFYHRLCPGTFHKCRVCGLEITDGTDVSSPLDVTAYHRHKACRLNLKPLTAEEREVDSSSWIVKPRK